MTSAPITAGAVQAGQKNANAPTLILVAGLAVTWLALPSEDAESLFKTAAIGVGLALALSTAMEAVQGVRALIRTDNLMLWVLYGLTLLEFLFPQPDVNGVVSVEAATRGATIVLLGFFGLAVGRHLIPQQASSSAPLDLKPIYLFGLFIFAFVVGYLHIFLAVNFDPIEMIEQMSRPRFSQSWGRGKFGNAYSLLYELNLLIYLLPPIAGLMLARAERFSIVQKVIVFAVLALTFYYAFASGTRNVLGTYVISMFGAYALTKPDLKLSQVLKVGVPVAGLLLFASTLMLEFRSAGGVTAIASEERHYDTLYIDHNLVNISNLTNVFPDAVPYLGLEIPYQAIIKPIPRALWEGKPEGLSTSIEAALGINDGVTTLACTFVGEAYMAWGFLGVLIAGLAFGAAAGWWNRTGRQVDSSFSQVLYASGFLAAAMGMRSLLTMVPFMLPTLALWLMGRYWLPKSKSVQTE
ncbi:O-antigen polymerase [Bradyrhizobium guangxiense]|uniref:O-antigen polymerase n=1 Tax=Bradyrhizobium guangxiense TaxID=1325115 RepID=UPI001008AE05|nr:O-antigen polymerase [Bradyrhizobium guangxiense]